MPDQFEKQVIFIAGATASGKSDAALRLAEEIGGEIINADAMQVYEDLRVVTARPSQADEARARHHLYGILDGAERCSAGRWGQMAATAIGNAHAAIVTGGTGLYFRALEEGLSPIPDIPADIRDKAMDRRAELGPDDFRQEVISKDPAMERLPAGDTQRLVRAWEVFAATGKPLSYFQGLARKPLIDVTPRRVAIEPPRDELYARCDMRAETMFEMGAVEEVRALLDRNLNPDLPVMKALGVPELAAFMAGDMGRDEALAALQQATRRFAKRQLTWFRNQAADWPRVATAQAAVDLFSG